MTLSDDIQDFQRSLLNLNESLEEIDQNSVKLLSCPMDELSTQLTSLSELLDEAYAELKRSQAQIDLLGDLWGGASFSSKSRSSKQSPRTEALKKTVTTEQLGLIMLTGLATQGTTTIQQSSWKEALKTWLAIGKLGLVMLTGLATQGTTTIVNTVRDVVLPTAEAIDRLPPNLTQPDTEDSSDRSQQDLISLYEMEQTAQHESYHSDSNRRKKKKNKKQ